MPWPCQPARRESRLPAASHSLLRPPPAPPARRPPLRRESPADGPLHFGRRELAAGEQAAEIELTRLRQRPHHHRVEPGVAHQTLSDVQRLFVVAPDGNG